MKICSRNTENIGFSSRAEREKSLLVGSCAALAAL